MRLLYVCDCGIAEKDQIYYASPGDSNMLLLLNKYFEDITIYSRKEEFNSSYRKVESDYEIITISKYDVLNLCKKIYSSAKKSDVVMCFGLNGYFAQVIAINLHKKVIAYMGGDNSETLLSMKSLKGYSAFLIYKFLDKGKCYFADYVHYCAPYLQKKYPARGLVLCKSPIGLLIDEEVLKKRIDKIKTDKNIITIGLIGYASNHVKGIDTAIRACALLNRRCRVKLKVVGAGNYISYIEMAKNFGVIENVEFIGTIPYGEKVLNWLDTIDIYIQPSRTEGLPKATVEAMSRACPVIASRVGALPDLIDESFLIAPGDYKALAEKISLFRNKQLLIEQAEKNFQKSYCYSKKVRDKEFDQFYGDIVKNYKVH